MTMLTLVIWELKKLNKAEKKAMEKMSRNEIWKRGREIFSATEEDMDYEPETYKQMLPYLTEIQTTDNHKLFVAIGKYHWIPSDPHFHREFEEYSSLENSVYADITHLSGEKYGYTVTRYCGDYKDEQVIRYQIPKHGRGRRLFYRAC